MVYFISYSEQEFTDIRQSPCLSMCNVMENGPGKISPTEPFLATMTGQSEIWSAQVIQTGPFLDTKIHGLARPNWLGFYS